MDATSNETMQKIQELYASIPESLQKAIMSSDYQRKLVDIGRETNLTVEQLGNLELQTTLVLLGATSPNNYPLELKENLGTKDEKIIGTIIDKVNENIFGPIREDLKEINSIPEGEPEDDDNETFWRHSEAEMNGVTAKEESTLKKSGIELEKTRPSSEENLLQTTVPASTLQSRANILDGIEHPTASKPSFVDRQLSGTFSMPTKETTYTPKPATPIPPPAGKPGAASPSTPTAPTQTASESPKSDPYREAF